MSESRLEGYRKGGFRTGEIQNGRDTTVLQTGGIKDCWEAGQVVYRTGGNQNWRDSRLEVFKTGGIQYWRDSIPPFMYPSSPESFLSYSLCYLVPNQGIRTGGIQDWRDSRLEGLNTGGIQSLLSCIPPVLHPSSCASLQSCIPQVVLLSCPVSSSPASLLL